jgi:CubicO group peptidase (beta-lactamase class C family)
MRRISILLALLLWLTAAGSAGLAQTASPAASPQVNLAGTMPLELTGDRLTAFESYIQQTMTTLGVPGASIAVVQGGKIVYMNGFGVRDLRGTAPVTPDTLMMIGSVNKSFTSMLAASLVDAGWLSWDTPVVDLLPEFAVSDPTLISKLTIADAFCACTGLPRHDAELIFNFDSLTPEKMIESIAKYPLTTPFGQEFQYSNQMYAIGGYAAAVAAGANPNDLDAGYRHAMQDRLLNPMGMTRSTFSLDDVLASGDYAMGYGSNLDGSNSPMSLLSEDGFVSTVAPAGALWSSARDMAAYLQTQLADGVAPDGTHVVSAANLDKTRQGRVKIKPQPGDPPFANEANQAYAMGWVTGAYKGQPMISHNGGTLGFISELAVLPDADLGLVILTNGTAGAGYFTKAVQFRLFELLFDQPPEIDQLLQQLLKSGGQQGPQFGQLDPSAVAPYLGRYTNPALGEISLRMQGDRVIFDGGEVRSGLVPVMDETGQMLGYTFSDAPLTQVPVLVSLDKSANGKPEVVVQVRFETAQTYVLAAAQSGSMATPSP